MTAATLPLVATRFDGHGPYWAAWSPIHAGPNDNIVWLAEARLPNPRYYRWATDAEVSAEHVTLDVGAVSELLFASGMDPDALDDDAAFAVIAAELQRVGCDMLACTGEVGAELAEHWEHTGRFNACTIRAARLRGVSL
jgi:hypothetical protein